MLLEAATTLAAVSYAERFKEGLARPGKTRKGAAEAMGISQQAVAAIVHGKTKSATAENNAAAAAYFGCDPTWLASGKGIPKWDDGGGPDAPAIGGRAHALSPQIQSDALPEITWESLVLAVPDSLFVLPLRDDALSPDFPAGTAVVWSRKRAVKPGRLVLLADRHGQHHARLVQESKTPGKWVAAAISRGFVQFDPDADQLEVIAVHRGILEAPDND